MSEEECRRANLPYGFEAVKKHVYQYQTFKGYSKYSGTHLFEPHVQVYV